MLSTIKSDAVLRFFLVLLSSWYGVIWVRKEGNAKHQSKPSSRYTNTSIGWRFWKSLIKLLIDRTGDKTMYWLKIFKGFLNWTILSTLASFRNCLILKSNLIMRRLISDKMPISLLKSSNLENHMIHCISYNEHKRSRDFRFRNGGTSIWYKFWRKFQLI